MRPEVDLVPDSSHSIAVVCDPEGKIVQVLRDDLERTGLEAATPVDDRYKRETQPGANVRYQVVA